MRGHTARDQVTATMDVEGITLQGSLGVATAADVRALLHTAIDAGSGDLVLHLGEAEVEDATGLGVIVEAHRRARRAGRQVVIADATPRLRRLLRATKLSRVIATIPVAEVAAVAGPVPA